MPPTTMGILIKFLLAFVFLVSMTLVGRQVFAQIEHDALEAKSGKVLRPVDKAPPKGAYKAAYAAYMAAKKACLKENKNLRRNKLKECIIAKTK